MDYWKTLESKTLAAVMFLPRVAAAGIGSAKAVFAKQDEHDEYNGLEYTSRLQSLVNKFKSLLEKRHGENSKAIEVTEKLLQDTTSALAKSLKAWKKDETGANFDRWMLRVSSALALVGVAIVAFDALAALSISPVVPFVIGGLAFIIWSVVKMQTYYEFLANSVITPIVQTIKDAGTSTVSRAYTGAAAIKKIETSLPEQKPIKLAGAVLEK